MLLRRARQHGHAPRPLALDRRLRLRRRRLRPPLRLRLKSNERALEPLDLRPCLLERRNQVSAAEVDGARSLGAEPERDGELERRVRPRQLPRVRHAHLGELRFVPVGSARHLHHRLLATPLRRVGTIGHLRKQALELLERGLELALARAHRLGTPLLLCERRAQPRLRRGGRLLLCEQRAVRLEQRVVERRDESLVGLEDLLIAHGELLPLRLLHLLVQVQILLPQHRVLSEEVRRGGLCEDLAPRGLQARLGRHAMLLGGRRPRRLWIGAPRQPRDRPVRRWAVDPLRELAARPRLWDDRLQRRGAREGPDGRRVRHSRVGVPRRLRRRPFRALAPILPCRSLWGRHPLPARAR